MFNTGAMRPTTRSVATWLNSLCLSLYLGKNLGGEVILVFSLEKENPVGPQWIC